MASYQGRVLWPWASHSPLNFSCETHSCLDRAQPPTCLSGPSPPSPPGHHRGLTVPILHSSRSDHQKPIIPQAFLAPTHLESVGPGPAQPGRSCGDAALRPSPRQASLPGQELPVLSPHPAPCSTGTVCPWTSSHWPTCPPGSLCPQQASALDSPWGMTSRQLFKAADRALGVGTLSFNTVAVRCSQCCLHSFSWPNSVLYNVVCVHLRCMCVCVHAVCLLV